MICDRTVKLYCKDDISRIENYDKAMSDTTQIWHCHHRLELTLDGEFAHSPDELIRLDMYYNRPYFELIFLTHAEHMKLHHIGTKHSEETKQKISTAKHNMSDETKRKISEALKGRTLSEETKRKISEARKGKKNHLYGKHRSEETRRKISESCKRTKAKNKI